MSNTLSLIVELQSKGVHFSGEGGELVVDAPKGLVTSEQREQIGHKAAEILTFVSRWPKECVDSALQFGKPEARLYPLIGKRVMTAAGPGVLWRVFLGSIGVVLDDDPARVTYFEDWGQIHPC